MTEATAQKARGPKKQRPYFGEAICENVLHNHVGIGSKGLLGFVEKTDTESVESMSDVFSSWQSSQAHGFDRAVKNVSHLPKT